MVIADKWKKEDSFDRNVLHSFSEISISFHHLMKRKDHRAPLLLALHIKLQAEYIGDPVILIRFGIGEATLFTVNERFVKDSDNYLLNNSYLFPKALLCVTQRSESYSRLI